MARRTMIVQLQATTLTATQDACCTLAAAQLARASGPADPLARRASNRASALLSGKVLRLLVPDRHFRTRVMREKRPPACGPRPIAVT